MHCLGNFGPLSSDYIIMGIEVVDGVSSCDFRGSVFRLRLLIDTQDQRSALVAFKTLVFFSLLFPN